MKPIGIFLQTTRLIDRFCLPFLEHFSGLKYFTMDKRYLENPFPDYSGDERPVKIDDEHVKNLICSYVDAILENCQPGSENDETRGDLYVGNAGK